MNDDYQKREMLGNLRTVARILSVTNDLAKEIWEDGETMLSPAQTRELGTLLTECKKYLSLTTKVSGRFSGVAELRTPV